MRPRAHVPEHRQHSSSSSDSGCSPHACGTAISIWWSHWLSACTPAWRARSTHKTMATALFHQYAAYTLRAQLDSMMLLAGKPIPRASAVITEGFVFGNDTLSIFHTKGTLSEERWHFGAGLKSNSTQAPARREGQLFRAVEHALILSEYHFSSWNLAFFGVNVQLCAILLDEHLHVCCNQC